MNANRNGIPVYVKPSQKLGKAYRPIANPYKVFVTLQRIEDSTKVWLMMPFNQLQVEALEREGWQKEEIWERKSMNGRWL